MISQQVKQSHHKAQQLYLQVYIPNTDCRVQMDTLKVLFIYLFLKGNMIERRRNKENFILYSLVHSSNSQNSQNALQYEMLVLQVATYPMHYNAGVCLQNANILSSMYHNRIYTRHKKIYIIPGTKIS